MNGRTWESEVKKKSNYYKVVRAENDGQMDNEDGADMNIVSEVRKDLRALKISKKLLNVLGSEEWNQLMALRNKVNDEILFL